MWELPGVNWGQRPHHEQGDGDADDMPEVRALSYRHIFEPDPLPAYEDLRRDPPPRYTPPRPGTGVGVAPPSIEAAQVDRAYWRLARYSGQNVRPPEVLEYLDALGRLITQHDAPAEVSARAARLISGPVVDLMSNMLQSPLEAEVSSLPKASASHLIALQYCRLLGAMVQNGMLKPLRVLRALCLGERSCPLLLNLASISRHLPKASHIMCDLLKAMLDKLPDGDGSATLRGRLLMLSDERGARGKYSSFCGRLVGDGRLSLNDMGPLVAIARLRVLELWPTAVEIFVEHRSQNRAFKHANAVEVCNAALENNSIQPLEARVMASMEVMALKLRQHIERWWDNERGPLDTSGGSLINASTQTTRL